MCGQAKDLQGSGKMKCVVELDPVQIAGAHFPSTAPILSLMANSGNFDPYALDKRQQQPQQQYPPIAVAAVAAPGYSQQPQAPLPYEQVPHRSSFEQPGASAPVGSHPGRFLYSTVAPRSASVRSKGADEYGQDEPRDFTQDRHSWGVGAVPASVEQVRRFEVCNPTALRSPKRGACS